MGEHASFCAGCGMRYAQERGEQTITDGPQQTWNDPYGAPYPDPYGQPHPNQQPCPHGGYGMSPHMPNPMDRPSLGWALLCFFLALTWLGLIIGIVMYIYFRGRFPLRARSCIRGVIWGIAFNITVAIFFGDELLEMVDTKS